jgi:hypothetical protein
MCICIAKAKKEDKDKIQLTDLIDKTRATKDERDADVAEVEAYLRADHSLANNEADIYAELTLRHEDIGADNDQIFLIEGDSLLQELLFDPLLDWSHGGQFLHAIYALEHYVRRFQEGGRIFRFVFFNSFGGVAWADSPFIQLFRETAIRHLREKLHILTNEFDNWWEKPFHVFLEHVDPAFILVGDGAGAGNPAAASAAASSSGVPAASASVSALSTYMSSLSLSSTTSRALPTFEIVRSLSLYLLAHHLRVIRLTELSFANNSMYAFQMAMALPYKKMLLAEGGYKPHEKLLEKADVSAAAVAASAVAASREGHADPTIGAPRYRVDARQSFDSKLHAKLAANANLMNDARLLNTTYALAKLLSLPASKQAATSAGLSLPDLAKAILVHTLLLRHLPVDSRCLVWEQADAKKRAATVKHASILQEFFAQLLVATVNTSSVPAASDADAAAALDLFDGRLLSFLLHVVNGGSVKSLGWSASMESTLLSAWDALKTEAPAAGLNAFLPFQSIQIIADKSVSDVNVAKLAAEVQAKVAEARAAAEKLAVAAGVPSKQLTAASPSAATVAPAKAPAAASAAAAAAADSDDGGSWEDEDTDDVPVPAKKVDAPKAAAPVAPAKKPEGDDDGGSWEDISDDEEETKAEPKKAESVAKPAVPGAYDDEDAAPTMVNKESAALLPATALDSKFVRDTVGSLDALLASNGLLVDSDDVPLTPYASAYKIAPGKVLDDGMDTEDKAKGPMSKRDQRAASRQVNYWEQSVDTLTTCLSILNFKIFF